MCGIAGKVGVADGETTREVVARMVASLRHRGPDSHGLEVLDGGAVFGHARLAIVDLSATGHQPMRSADGRYAITYNGEVYNFQELRDELAREGARFRGTSDTEVVLAAYARWGTKCFARFSGMFALAIWDSALRELVLARDRFGKKPLYYTALGGGLAFASELGALRRDPAVDGKLEVSRAALNHYLAIGYVLGPLSIYRDVWKLDAASYLRWKDGRVVEKSRYWEYADCFRRRARGSEPELARELERLLDRAVKYRLISDVPVGTFLSGGIDSSGIAALAKRHLDYPLHSFTIGFAADSYDESPDARFVAERIGSVHHERRIDDTDSRALVERAIACYDEPFSDTSLVPTVEVARLASEHVKVVLSGDGGDEIFGGYSTYVADRMKRRLDPIPPSLWRMGSHILRRAKLPFRGKVGLDFKLRQFLKGAAEPWRKAHYSWRELHALDERVEILGRAHTDELVESDPFRTFARYYDDVPDLDELSQHLYVDAKTWLVDDVLVKVDRATMAFGLEARAPLLDADLVAFAASLPPGMKIRGRVQKYVLKRALEGVLPGRTIHKKKSGFNAPINSWLGNARGDEFSFFNRHVAERRGLLARGTP